MYNRRRTKVVQVGGLAIGGENPITIESMTNTKTADAPATVAQIKALYAAGCEIVRIAVNDKAAALGFREIRRQVDFMPLIADIHFDHTMALLAVESGADKIRINPGNIGSHDRIRAVVDACKSRVIPIRVGVNAGSLEQALVDKFGGVTAEGLAESALKNVRLLEDFGFDNIVASMKASNIPMTLDAHKIFAPQTDYPLHIGITEAGTLYSGTIKSVAGISALLTQGLGDTIRISLTADPVEEVRAAKEMLQSLRLRTFTRQIISCPTCGRTEVDLPSIAAQIERATAHITAPITIAIMGCVVNGPGEAREADIGVSCGAGSGLIFKKGVPIRTVAESEIVPALLKEINALQSSTEN